MYYTPGGAGPRRQVPAQGAGAPPEYALPAAWMPAWQAGAGRQGYQAYGQTQGAPAGTGARQCGYPMGYPPGQYPVGVGRYQPPLPGASPHGGPYAMTASQSRGSVLCGVAAMALGASVVGSTFLPWITAGAAGFSASMSGLNIMTGSYSAYGGGGFSLVITGNGSIFFSGFFSLLLGALILATGLVMLFRRRMGGIATLVCALPATGLAAVNIAMVLSKIEGASTGFGLWIFCGAALAALAFGIVGLSSSG